jgi:hypothetical protein
MTFEELEARLRKLEDIEEIKKLQARYAYLVDTFQADKVPDLFADDFIMELEGKGTFTSKDEVLMIFRGMAKWYSMTCHQTTTPYIEVDGDRAKATWYLFGPFTRETREGSMAVWEGGRYDNEYVRERGQWKFSRWSFKFSMHTPYEDGWVKTPMKDV